MVILDGKATSIKLNHILKEKVKKLENKPRLDIILIGEDPASNTYVKNKIKTAEEIGFTVKLNRFNNEVSQAEIEQFIAKLNQNKDVDGILLQLPLPKHLDDESLINLIDYHKDVDGFHTINQGRLFKKEVTILPATPKGIMMLLTEYQIDVSGMHAVIIGRSQIVGAPIAKMLLDANATVTITHSKTKDLSEIVKQADLIVAAIGRANFVTSEMVKPGAIVIDVGINRLEGKLVGDVDFEKVKELTSFITPVPGGVGPMTICALGYNLYEIAKGKSK